MSVSVHEITPAIWLVELNRPHVRNAVDRDTADALSAAFRAFDEAPSSAVAVLHGSSGHFCAGADLKAIHSGSTNRLEADGDGPMGPTRLRLRKPVIAAVAGYAVAGGLELALWCDLRVADSSAKFGVTCRRVGVPLIDGGTYRLPLMIGLGRALDLVLTGRIIDAREALAIGLVNRVVEEGHALSASLELAHSLAAFPQQTLRADRASVYGGLGMREREALAQEFANGLPALAAEGLAGAGRFSAGQGRHGAALDAADAVSEGGTQ
jgi:enoyl-CoA hydratase